MPTRPTKLDDLPDVLTADQLVAFLPIGRNSVYGLLAAGKIHALRVGKKYIIPKQSLLDYLCPAAYNTGIQTATEPANLVSFEREDNNDR